MVGVILSVCNSEDVIDLTFSLLACDLPILIHLFPFGCHQFCIHGAPTAHLVVRYSSWLYPNTFMIATSSTTHSRSKFIAGKLVCQECPESDLCIVQLYFSCGYYFPHLWFKMSKYLQAHISFMSITGIIIHSVGDCDKQTI